MVQGYSICNGAQWGGVPSVTLFLVTPDSLGAYAMRTGSTPAKAGAQLANDGERAWLFRGHNT